MTQSNAKPLVKLDIDALSYGPYGVGRVDGKAVMVPHTAPGDQIEARITESKERYAIGEIVRLLRPSSARQSPPCPYVGACGGCSWQHITYETQLKAKEQSVSDALRRIGKLDGFELRPIIPSALEYRYRRRIRLQVGADKRLGFFGASSHRLVEIDACLIADDRINRVIKKLQSWIRDISTAIEHIEVVTGDESQQLVVVAQGSEEFVSSDAGECEKLTSTGGPLNGLIFLGRSWRQAWGQTSIAVRLSDSHSVSVEAEVFTQINPDANRRILEELLRAGEFRNSDRILELFSGAGNFTLPIALQTKQIVAVEGYQAAVASGQRNAAKYSIGNIRWICAPVPRAVAQLKQRRERFDTIVLDPPRAGAKDLMPGLTALGAKTILYVSCNPATLARDLAVLVKHGYKLRMVQPVDMFPQTFHVEALALLER